MSLAVFSSLRICRARHLAAITKSAPNRSILHRKARLTHALVYEAERIPSAVDIMTNPASVLNPLDVYRSHLAEILCTIVDSENATIYRSLHRTQTLDKGDLVLAVPALRIKGQEPQQIANLIVQEFPDSPWVEKPLIAGLFVQFFFKPPQLMQLILPTILQRRDDYGRVIIPGLKDPADPSKGRKKVIVEFGSPNIAKPFHAGHLRSTIIGGFLANLYEQSGWEVVRMNYLGDWGKQYGVLAVGFEEFGDEEALQANPIGHLFDVYVKISAIGRTQDKTDENSVDERARRYFKRMCDGDEQALSLWKKFRDLSIVKYKETFARLNIFYDEYAGESQILEESMDTAARLLQEKSISEPSDGAVIVDLTKYAKKLGKTIVRKRDGTSIYLTRDISAVTERAKVYNYDKMIYVIAMQQDLHMAQLIKIIELMYGKDVAGKLQHINFGLVNGMSTRRGTVKFLDDILRDTADKMHEVMKANEVKYQQIEDPVKTADVLAVSAVLVQDMSGKRINGYTFDMDRMTSFEGDTGPYLQYSHARLCSIIRKAGLAEEELVKADFSLLTEPTAIELVRMLSLWPEVFLQTIKTEEPVTILTYLFKMTHVLNSSYDRLNILKSELKIKAARLALYYATRQVLQNGMRLLGLQPLERM